MSRKQLSLDALSKLDERDLQKEISKVVYQGLLVKSDHGEFFEGIALGLNKDGNLLAAAARDSGRVLDARTKKKRSRSRTRSKTPPRRKSPARSKSPASGGKTRKSARSRSKSPARSRSKSPAGRTRSRSPSATGKKTKAKKGGKKGAKKGVKKGTKKGSKKGSKKSSKKQSKKDSEAEESKTNKKAPRRKAQGSKKTKGGKGKIDEAEVTGECRVCSEAADNFRVQHSGAADGRPDGVKICRMCKECADQSNLKCRMCGTVTGKEGYTVDQDLV